MFGWVLPQPEVGGNMEFKESLFPRYFCLQGWVQEGETLQLKL